MFTFFEAGGGLVLVAGLEGKDGQSGPLLGIGRGEMGSDEGELKRLLMLACTNKSGKLGSS